MSGQNVKKHDIRQGEASCGQEMRERKVEQYRQRRKHGEVQKSGRHDAGGIGPGQNHAGDDDHGSDNRDAGSGCTRGCQLWRADTLPKQSSARQHRDAAERDQRRQIHHGHRDWPASVKQKTEGQQRRKRERPERDKDGSCFPLVDLTVGQCNPKHPGCRRCVTDHWKCAQSQQQFRRIVGRREVANQQLAHGRAQHSRRQQMRPLRSDNAPGKINQAQEQRGRNQLARNYQ